MTPKDYSSIVQDFAMSGEFKIAINGEWCQFFVMSSESICSARDYQVDVRMAGFLSPFLEFSGVKVGRTVARLGDINIPCEINGCSFHYQRGTMTQQNITLDICFRYSMHNYNHGYLTNTIDDVPSELVHMVEIADGSRKKTFFDWIDLD